MAQYVQSYPASCLFRDEESFVMQRAVDISNSVLAFLIPFDPFTETHAPRD